MIRRWNSNKAAMACPTGQAALRGGVIEGPEGGCKSTICHWYRFGVFLFCSLNCPRGVVTTEPPKPPDDPFGEFARRRQHFLIEWEIGVLPQDSNKESLVAHAMEFALTAIRSSYLLNGGGLGAIPTLAVLFGIDAKENMYALMVAGVLFALGLVCAAVTNLLAYIEMLHEAQAVHERREGTAKTLSGQYNSFIGRDERAPKEEIEKHTDECKKMERMALKLTKVALWVFGASIAFFIAGGAVLMATIVSS